MAVWEWKNDSHNWEAYLAPQCVLIQAAKVAGQTEVKLTSGYFSGKNYFIDFKTHKQVNKSTNYKREVRLKPGSVPVTPLPPAPTGPIDDSELEELRKKIAAEKLVNEKLSQELLVRQESSQRHKKGESELAHKIVEVKRDDRRHVVFDESIWPAEWSKDQKETSILVNLDSKSAEYKQLEIAFMGSDRTSEYQVKSSNSNAKVVKIERIQNKHLWTIYAAEMERLKTKNKGNANEMLLYHGTKNTAPEIIYHSERGFDHAFASNGMWGKGIYFADNARFPNGSYKWNVPGTNLRQILIAKVVVGEGKDYGGSSKNSLKRPPEKAPFKQGHLHEFYDSVIANLGASDSTYSGKMYVVYDNCCAYPHALVTYSV